MLPALECLEDDDLRFFLDFFLEEDEVENSVMDLLRAGFLWEAVFFFFTLTTSSISSPTILGVLELLLLFLSLEALEGVLMTSPSIW